MEITTFAELPLGSTQATLPGSKISNTCSSRRYAPGTNPALRALPALAMVNESLGHVGRGCYPSGIKKCCTSKLPLGVVSTLKGQA